MCFPGFIFAGYGIVLFYLIKQEWHLSPSFLSTVIFFSSESPELLPHPVNFLPAFCHQMLSLTYGGLSNSELEES